MCNNMVLNFVIPGILLHIILKLIKSQQNPTGDARTSYEYYGNSHCSLSYVCIYPAFGATVAAVVSAFLP